MPKKLAIDWDDDELRMVVAMCSGNSVKVLSADVISLSDTNLDQALSAALDRHGLERCETFVTIGRGRAELRDLQLPPVPDEELPDMVRFQAVRSFASAGDSATIDFLVTQRTDRGVEMIAAAIAPAKLDSVRQVCNASHLQLRRIALRPLAAAALFVLRDKDAGTDGETVLIDLLAGDAEIVVLRDGKVVFLRTVKLPTSSTARPSALAGELRRSLVAAGSSSAPQKVVLWGRQSVHQDEVATIADAIGTTVVALDPFSLVDVDPAIADSLPMHSGRLAPLVGLIAADEAGPEYLIDFLNPRKRPEQKPNRLKNALLIGAPIAAMLGLGFLVYRQMGTLDSQIDSMKTAIAELEPRVKVARVSVDRTERVDQFLDGDVNWLAEMKRLADVIPPSDQLIIRSIAGTTDQRAGGGRLTLTGAVTDPAVIDQLEAAVRDSDHQVVGEGSSEQRTEDVYRWTFSETVSVNAESIRNARYEGLAPQDENAANATPAPAVDNAANSDAPSEASPDVSSSESGPAPEPGPTPENESLNRDSSDTSPADEATTPSDETTSPMDEPTTSPDTPTTPIDDTTAATEPQV